ncbi:hypothetical protein BV898_14517 [Hypsibius exemplaris]|uniref:Uncharacterized protein n=1 Tax=Hypsibius exemplaris TaxID=2072580 RepID=A0A9X6RJM4_HYPEX|nr:hypothetical protein BV898_14517 [Hypsibius exemplaris]
MSNLVMAAFSTTLLQVLLMAGPAVVAQSAETGRTNQFDIPDKLIMTYSTPSQRNQVLQQIMVMWRNALNEYQSSNVAIKFTSESISTSAIVQTADAQPTGRRMQVTYHITGQSVLPIDAEKVTTSAHQTIVDAHVAGVELLTATDSSATSQVMESQDGGTQQFSTTETVTLTYTSVSQREQFLQQILTFWRTALMTYQATNIQIEFVGEASASTATKEVTYRITATTATTVDTETVKSSVRQTIQNAHLTGITIGSQPTNTDQGDTDSDGQTSTDTQPTGPSTKTFSTTDTITLTYSTNGERDQLLQQILTFWRTALTSYQATNVRITFVSENPSQKSTGSMVVKYRITATASSRISKKTVKSSVRKTIQDSHLAGIQVESITRAQIQGGAVTATDDGADTTDQRLLAVGTQQQSEVTSTATMAQASNEQDDNQQGLQADMRSNTGVNSQTSGGQSFQTTDAVQMKYTNQQERDALLQQVLDQWKLSFGSNQVSNIEISFVSEKASGTTAYKFVVYKITAHVSSPIDHRTVKKTVHQKLRAARFAAVNALSVQVQNLFDASPESVVEGRGIPRSSKQQRTATSSQGDQSNPKKHVTTTTSPDDGSLETDTGIASIDEIGSGTVQTITDTISLAYSTTEDRNRSVEWIRRLWAYVLGVEVRTVRVTVVSDMPIQSSFLGFLQADAQGHNVTYTITVTQTIPAFDADALKIKFQQLLPASTTSYLVTFPAGSIPTKLNITTIDQIRGPQRTKDVEQQSLQAFMIYDTISFSFKTIQERNKILEIIRRSWEQALGRGAVTVDLVVHQDTPNSDGSHRITYLLTILSKRNEWDIKMLETKFRQVLSEANIPSLVTPDPDSLGSFTAPPADSGVRSFVFYDTIGLSFTTDTQRTEALEKIRAAWEKVLGINAWNVQVSVYRDTADTADTAQTPSTHQVSYTILFSSNNQTEWNFDALETQFKAMLITIKGTGFSAVLQAEERSGGSSDQALFRAHHMAVSNQDRRQSNSQWSRLNREGSVREMSNHSWADSSVVFTYFLSDAIKFDYSEKSELDAALESIRFMWSQLLGSKASDVQVSLNSDFKSAASSRHTVHYHVLIVSRIAHFESDLEGFRSQFWSSLSTSDNVMLRKAKRLLVLPFISGSLDSVQVEIASTTQEMSSGSGGNAKIFFTKSMNSNESSSSSAEDSSSSDIQPSGSSDSGSGKVVKVVKVTANYQAQDGNGGMKTTSSAPVTDKVSDGQQAGLEEIDESSSNGTQTQDQAQVQQAVIKSAGSSTNSSGKTDRRRGDHEGRKKVPVEIRGWITIRYRNKRQRQDAFDEIRRRWSRADVLRTSKILTILTSHSNGKSSHRKIVHPNWANSDRTTPYTPWCTPFRVSFRRSQQDQLNERQVRRELRAVLARAHPDFWVDRQIDDDQRGDDNDNDDNLEGGHGHNHHHNNDNNRRKNNHESGKNRDNQVDIHGSVTIRYRNKRQREDALNEIKRRWTRSEILGNVNDLDIEFDQEIPTPQWAQLGPDNTVHTLVYSVTGLTRHGQPKLEENKVKRELRTVLARSNLDFWVERQPDDSQIGNDDGHDDHHRGPTASSARKSLTDGGTSSSSRRNNSYIQSGHQLNAYIIHDSFRITAENDNEREAYLELVEQAWQNIFGNDTELVQAAVYQDDILAGKNFKTHDVKYAVVIVSSDPSLDLQAAKASFGQIKPKTNVALVAPEPLPVSSFSNALVLLQSITFSYVTEQERDEFINGVEEQWQMALGKSFQLIEVWLYDEAVIDQSLDVKVKTTSELSYAVLIVSQAEVLDAHLLMRQLEQYLLTRMVALSHTGNSTACAVTSQ